MTLTLRQKSEGILGAAAALLNHANIANPDPERIALWARNFGWVTERQEDPAYPGDPHRGTDFEVLRVVDPATGQARYTPNIQGVQEPMPTEKLAVELLYLDQLTANARIAAGSRRH